MTMVEMIQATIDNAHAVARQESNIETKLARWLGGLHVACLKLAVAIDRIDPTVAEQIAGLSVVDDALRDQSVLNALDAQLRDMPPE